MPSVALLLRLSTMLLVPVLVLTGLGSPGQDRTGGEAPEAEARARALVASSATAERQLAEADKASSPRSPRAVGIAEADRDAKAKGQKAKAAQKAKAKKAEKAKAKKAANAKAKKAKKAAKAKKAKKAANARPRSLYLAVGHGRAPNGRWDPGAEHPGNGAVEVDSAQVMVDAMVEVLRDAPGVQLTSESGDHPNVIGSVAAANAAGVDDCIEVHQDTAAAPVGAFGHWYSGSTAAHRLANGLIESVHERGVPIRRDWHRARSGLYWLRKSTCRAVLVEIGRVADYGPEELRELGRGMAQAYLHDTAKARNVPPPR